jgi:selenocysteine lyase/cysteine desulfurase
MTHVTLHTPISQELSAGIVCFEITGMKPHHAVERLRKKGIIGSVTPYAAQYVRLAPGLLNQPGEIDTVLGEINNLKV